MTIYHLPTSCGKVDIVNYGNLRHIFGHFDKNIFLFFLLVVKLSYANFAINI